MRTAHRPVALLVLGLCALPAACVGVAEDDGSEATGSTASAQTVVVADDPDKGPPKPSFDPNRFDFRRPWQRTCRPDERWSTPGKYWVTTKNAGCRDKAATNGRWDAVREAHPDGEDVCFYVWKGDSPLLSREDASALEALAKTVAGAPAIQAPCAKVTQLGDEKGRMLAPCPHCECPDCGVVYGGELYTILPRSWTGRTIGAQGPTDFTLFRPAGASLKLDGVAARLGLANGAVVPVQAF